MVVTAILVVMVAVIIVISESNTYRWTENRDANKDSTNARRRRSSAGSNRKTRTITL